MINKMAFLLIYVISVAAFSMDTPDESGEYCPAFESQVEVARRHNFWDLSRQNTTLRSLYSNLSYTKYWSNKSAKEDNASYSCTEESAEGSEATGSSEDNESAQKNIASYSDTEESSNDECSYFDFIKGKMDDLFSSIKQTEDQKKSVKEIRIKKRSDSVYSYTEDQIWESYINGNFGTCILLDEFNEFLKKFGLEKSISYSDAHNDYLRIRYGIIIEILSQRERQQLIRLIDKQILNLFSDYEISWYGLPRRIQNSHPIKTNTAAQNGLIPNPHKRTRNIS